MVTTSSPNWIGKVRERVPRASDPDLARVGNAVGAAVLAVERGVDGQTAGQGAGGVGSHAHHVVAVAAEISRPPADLEGERGVRAQPGGGDLHRLAVLQPGGRFHVRDDRRDGPIDEVEVHQHRSGGQRERPDGEHAPGGLGGAVVGTRHVGIG